MPTVPVKLAESAVRPPVTAKPPVICAPPEKVCLLPKLLIVESFGYKARSAAFNESVEIAEFDGRHAAIQEAIRAYASRMSVTYGGASGVCLTLGVII